jgi:hypothetical protein
MIALDPRLQVPDSLTLADPAHPLNIVRQTREIQNQAAADAMYDIPTPERFRRSGGKAEGFRSPFDGPTDIALAVGLLGLLLVFWLYARNTTRSLYTLVIGLCFALLFLVYKKVFDI